jgi:glycosyltransferase involved in cell wall biosynthesis
MAPYTVIHNGIAEAFLNAQKPRPDGRRIAAVMRLARIKNPEMLAAVAERLRDLGFSVELITGHVSRAMMARLSAVRLLPQTNCTEDLATFFGSCCSVLSPSHFEVSGNVPLEAVACGTPAVITDRMGICEIFRSIGLQALIISAGDLEGAVARLTDAAPISESVRDYLRANYRWPDVCSRIIAVA